MKFTFQLSWGFFSTVYEKVFASFECLSFATQMIPFSLFAVCVCFISKQKRSRGKCKRSSDKNQHWFEIISVLFFFFLKLFKISQFCFFVTFHLKEAFDFVFLSLTFIFKFSKLVHITKQFPFMPRALSFPPINIGAKTEEKNRQREKFA